MAETVNRFVKGIVSDLNPLDVDNQSWVFPTMNMRITQEGDMMVAKPITGNEVLFDLPTDYHVIGAKEYSNVLYLVLFKEEDSQVKIYSYPSVKEEEDGFNYELGPVPFIKDKDSIYNRLNYDGNKVDLLFTSSFDGTVDIYLNDAKNPTYVINNCFNPNGEFIDRQVDISLIPEKIKLINSTSSPVIIMDEEVTEGGKLPPGNYQIFIRYIDAAFNSTSFVSESKIISVASGDMYSDNYVGKFRYNDERPNFINKRIECLLSNLDNSFKYYQVAVVFYSSNVNDEALPTTYLITEYYDINENKLIITGYEKQETLSIDEVSAIISSDVINKSQAIINNRYIGANWESPGYDVNVFKSYASEVSVSSVSKTLDSKIAAYAPNEIYGLGIVFVLKGGIETDVYPLDGKDFLNGVDLPEGLFFNYNVKYRNLDTRFGFEFYLKDLKTILADDENVIGFYLMRSERIKNVISHGIVISMNDGLDAELKDGSHDYKFLNSPVTGATEGTSYPNTFFTESYPTYISTDAKWGMRYARHYTSESAKRKLAFFSPETLFNDVSNIIDFDDGRYYLQADVNFNSPDYIFTSDFNIENRTLISGLNKTTNLGPPLNNIYQDVELTFIPSGQVQYKGDYSSFINDPRSRGGGLDPFMFDDYDTGWDYTARSALFNNYLGIKRLDGNNFDLPFGYALARINQFKNYDDYIEFAIAKFDSRLEFYTKITDFIPKDTNTNRIMEFDHGDTFSGEITMRGHKWFGAASLVEIDDGNDPFDSIYQHGSVMTFFTRSSVNFHIRTNQDALSPDGIVKGQYSFLPLQNYRLKEWFITSSLESDMHESTKLNAGYSVTIPTKRYIGYDDIALPKSNSFITRLRSSSKRVSGSYLNAFKDFKINQYQDYDEQYGPIVGIYNLYNHLISIQHDAINMHYTQEQAGGEYDIVLGASTKFLYEKLYMKATYGAQSRDHILETPEFIYGVDIKNLVFWKIGTGSTPEGKQVIGVDNLTKTKRNEKYLTNILLSIQNDIEDINIGYDEHNKEVLFTIKYNVDGMNPTDPGYDDGNDNPARSMARTVTIVYSEKYQALTGTYSLPAQFYATFINSLISFNSIKGYIHNIDSPQLNIFGVDYSMILSYIVTGVSKDTSPMVKKFFEAIKLRSPNAKLVKIDFSTGEQQGTLTPFYDKNRFWLQPKYNEYHWEVPIPVNKDKGNIFGEGSVMKGEWLKVTLEYRGQEEFYIVYATTLFNPINY